MNRRTVIRALACSVVAAPFMVSAQSTAAIRRIGVLSSAERPPSAEFEHEFDSLRELGWTEGENLLIERRYASGRADLLKPFAEELVQLKVELIITNGTNAALAVKNATSSIPIVLWGAGDPVRTGLVASLARPGVNITGMSI